MNRNRGFTLLEILIALFIFSILSLILASALRNVINVQSRTELSAERLRGMQLALLILSRDIEQAVNRPVLSASGKEEAAFLGGPTGFTFTHAGYANPTAAYAQSMFQRTRYQWDRDALFRMTWPVLDQAPESQPHTRRLLSNVTQVRFEYLDKKRRFQNQWPVEGEAKQALPRAVRITLTVSQWGTISQLYVIPVQTNQTAQSEPKS